MTPIIKGGHTLNITSRTTLTDLINSGKLMFVCADMADNFIIKNYSEAKSNEWSFLPNGCLSEFPAVNPFNGNMKLLRSLYSTS